MPLLKRFSREIESDFYWYLAPAMECHHCLNGILLPYGVLPQTDEERLSGPEDIDQLTWPSDGWSAMFVCHECGRLDTYSDQDVTFEIVPKRAQGTYHDDATVYRVRFSCANKHCKAPAEVYIDTRDKTAHDCLTFLRSPDVRGLLACGHEIMTIPEALYKVERINERLW